MGPMWTKSPPLRRIRSGGDSYRTDADYLVAVLSNVLLSTETRL